MAHNNIAASIAVAFIAAIALGHPAARAATSAANITNFSPQGEVAQVRQVRASFGAAMVDFGDPKLAAPFDIKCAAAGSGRWVDDRSWVYDFNADLGPGERCAFALKPNTKTRDGRIIAGKTAFDFSTGGPAVLRSWPSAGGGEERGIDEEQVFVLLLNGAATPASVQQHAWCEVSGIGERIAVKIAGGADAINYTNGGAASGLPGECRR